MLQIIKECFANKLTWKIMPKYEITINDLRGCKT